MIILKNNLKSSELGYNQVTGMCFCLHLEHKQVMLFTTIATLSILFNMMLTDLFLFISYKEFIFWILNLTFVGRHLILYVFLNLKKCEKKNYFLNLSTFNFKQLFYYMFLHYCNITCNFICLNCEKEHFF